MFQYLILISTQVEKYMFVYSNLQCFLSIVINHKRKFCPARKTDFVKVD